MLKFYGKLFIRLSDLQIRSLSFVIPPLRYLPPPTTLGSSWFHNLQPKHRIFPVNLSYFNSLYYILQALEVEFNTGEQFRYPAELLRVESPAANATHSFSNKNSSTLPQVVHGRRYVGILDVEPVGRYALRIQFDDLHGTGIFSWQFLHTLGLEKYKRMRQYIKALKQQGLSRDPRPLSRVAKARVEEPM
jgi:DUF971 family protein